MPSNDGGLGEHLVGDKIPVGERNLHVVKLLGEGRCNMRLRAGVSFSSMPIAYCTVWHLDHFPHVVSPWIKVAFRMFT